MVEEYFTVKELAQRWKVGEKKVYRMKDKGEIPFTQIGGTIRFPRDQILEWERTHTTPSKNGNE